MHPFPCGRVMGCPIAMGRNICRLLASLVYSAISQFRNRRVVLVARALRLYLHGFLIDLRGPGGIVGIVHLTYLVDFAHVCAHAYHTNCVIGTGVLWSKSPSQRAGCSPENRSSLAPSVRTRTCTNVLPRVLPTADQKTASFRDCPSQLARTLAPQDTVTTIGKVRVCTYVQRGEVRSVVRCQHRRPAPANQLQIPCN